MLHTYAGPADRPTTTKVNRVSKVQQICVYCGSTEHRSSSCHRRPWGNREQPHSTPDSLRRDQQANSKILEAPLVGHLLWVPLHWDTHRSSNITGPIPKNLGPNTKTSPYYRNNNYNYDYRESQRQASFKV